ncbi:uncharacterized protein LOC100212081 isoform X4 [Hydra vulgaris]|uniref:uncharacterized protein LOC100212081 isoform X4 n=1 Tax=Hydra vulgaris TaxID=6087 RepID=UPI000192687E|nr:uncharacterized protein LOC100212081 isoform X2 [Hydra vulgaris]
MDWKDLLSASNEELLKLREYSGCDLEIKLIQLMNGSSHQTNLKDAALVDCFFNIYKFFQHHELYRYLFTVDQEQQELLKEMNFQALPQMQTFPPPLDEAINEEWLRIEYPTNQHLEEIENESCESNANIKSNVTLDDICKETAENLLSTLTKSKIKLLVNESAEKKLNTVQQKLKQRIEDKEASLLKVLQKFTLS